MLFETSPGRPDECRNGNARNFSRNRVNLENRKREEEEEDCKEHVLREGEKIKKMPFLGRSPKRLRCSVLRGGPSGDA